MQFDRYLSYFITNAEKMTTELENPLILLHEKKLTNLQPMVPLEAVAVWKTINDNLKMLKVKL